MPNSVILGQTVLRNYADRQLVFQSFKFIGTSTDQSATYDFLLVIHSNNSCLFRNKKRYLQSHSQFCQSVANLLKFFVLSILKNFIYGRTLEIVFILLSREQKLTIITKRLFS